MTISTTLSTERATFAGIDFHKRFSIVTLGDAKGEVIAQERLENDEHQIRKFFLRHSPLICAVENCRANEWFVETMKSCGCDVKVSNTFAVRLIADSRKKNDKIDSRILMELLARDYLPVCYQASQEERLLRERLRWRNKLVRSRTQYSNMAHALMDKENKGRKIKSIKQRNQLHEANLTAERQQRLEKNSQVIDYFDERVGSEDRELASIAKMNPNVTLLKTIPGIGNVSALVLLAELGDVTRFRRARNVGSYFGLVPKLYASSDTRRLGRITKQGSGFVRRMLVQDAWMAVRCSKAFRHKYHSIMKRRGKKIAIVAIARTLAEIAFRVLKDQIPFDESKVTLG